MTGPVVKSGLVQEATQAGTLIPFPTATTTQPGVAQFGTATGTIADGGTVAGIVAQTASLSGQLVNNPNYLFAPDTGLQARYLMLEGSGTTLNDKSGKGNNITITTSGVISGWAGTITVPTWTSDYGLAFTSGSAYLNVPTAVQAIQTVEVVFANAADWRSTSTQAFASPTAQQGLTGYGTVSPGPQLLLGTGYTGNSGGDAGFANTYLSSYSSGQGSAAGYAGAIDNGLHVAVMEINQSSGAMSVWLDGVPQTQMTPAGTSAPSTSGGNWQLGGLTIGANNNGYGSSGFSGTVYGASYSTSALTQQQISQDYAAWKQIAAYKGAMPKAAYGPKISGPYIHTIGESITWGHGLSNQMTQNFTQVAVSALTSATGTTWTGDAEGNDSASSYTLTGGGSPQGNCATEFPAIAPGISGPKFAIFHDNGNAERGPYNPWPDISPTTATGIKSMVYRDLSSLGACAKIAQANGWVTILGMEFSSGATGTSADASQKDASNPLRRQYARTYFDAYFDETNDARFGADGAATARGSTSDTSCTLSGTAGPSYQTDYIHPTACGQSVLGQDLTVLLEYLTNTRNGATPDTIASTSSTMLATDAGNTVLLPGAGASYTLQPCGGQMQGENLVTVENNGSLVDTILPGTEPNNGAADLLNGLSTGYALAPGTTATFQVTRGSDAAGTCGIQGVNATPISKATTGITLAALSSQPAANVAPTGATQLSAFINSVTSCPSSSPYGAGQIAVGPGQGQHIYNGCAYPIMVYPPAGYAIGIQGANTPLRVGPGLVMNVDVGPASSSQVFATVGMNYMWTDTLSGTIPAVPASSCSQSTLTAPQAVSGDKPLFAGTATPPTNNLATSSVFSIPSGGGSIIVITCNVATLAASTAATAPFPALGIGTR